MAHLLCTRGLVASAVVVWFLGGGRGPVVAQSVAPDTSLTAAGHNQVVKAAQDHYEALARALDLRTRKRQGQPKPTEREILEALLKVEQVPSNAKTIVRAALQRLPSVDRASQRRSPSIERSLKEIDDLLASARTPRDVLQRVSERRRLAGRTDAPGLALALRLSEDMLRDGLSTIYSSRNRFYREMAKGGVGDAELDNGDAADVAKEDVKGAVAGGIGGFVAGGPAAAGPAAAVAAVGKSAAEVVGKVWDWIAD